MTEPLEIALAEPRQLEAAGTVVAHALPGNGRRLVVALSGAGRPQHDIPPPEFVTPASAGGRNHVLFLADRSRSWMNGPGVAAEMVRLIEDYRAQNGITSVVTLGSAMGGYAALILPDLIAVDTAIAFAPQFSIKPDRVPEETRWAGFAEGIDTWPYPDIGALDAGDTTYFLFHGDNAWEARHWLRFPWRRSGRINHLIFAGQSHNIAPVLQKRRMLGRVVDLAIAQKPRAVRQALVKSFLGRSFIVQRREGYQPAHPELSVGPGGAPMVTPDMTESGA